MTEQALSKETTSHPHVVINKDVCDGSPIIAGTRIRVIDIVIEYEVLGRSPDEIIRSYPHVNLYQIHDALSFYYENRDELDRKIKQRSRVHNEIKRAIPVKDGLSLWVKYEFTPIKDVAIAQGLQRRGVEAFSARDGDKLGLTDEGQ